MLRKLLLCTMLFVFLVSSLVSAQAPQDMTLLDKTTTVEKIYYGSEQTGSLVERIGKLERDIYGLETKEALMAKIDRIYLYTKDNSVLSPSFLIKLNSAEWAFSHSVTSHPVKARMDSLEQVLLGTTSSGAFDDRLSKLLKLAYTNGQVDIDKTMISKDTLIKTKIVSPLSTRDSRVGDVVLFEAAEDLYVGGDLVVAKGAAGMGKITKIEPSKNFGRDAELVVSFDSMEAIDGSALTTYLGDKAKEETKSLAKAAGATVAGLAILGPIGVVGGAFVHGQEVAIPAGTEIYIQVKADSDVFGLQTNKTN